MPVSKFPFLKELSITQGIDRGFNCADISVLSKVFDDI